MRKKLIVMLAGLLTVLSMGFGAAQFSDVPAGHWAREAVEATTARGIIGGFPDGTFRGNENLTRYQAALIIYRLLQLLEAEKGSGPATSAVRGMTDEEKAALQNAIQELAAELAALGVRLSALEDNAATREDVATLQAQIDKLKAGLASASALDQQALQDLADRVEAASVAADTALARAQELGERIDGVRGDLAALKSEVEANSDSISALNELAVLLNQDVLSLQDRVTAIEKAIAGIDEQLTEFATLEDAAALQEFASALRTDLIALSEKVSALETGLAGIDKRVAALEANRFTLSGSLSVRYGYRSIAPTGAPDFDSTRAIDTIFDDDTGGVAVRDFANRHDTSLDARTNFTLRKAITGSGLEVSEATATFRWLTKGDIYDTTLDLPAFNLKGAVDGQDFTFRYSHNNVFKFTEYVFDNDNPITGLGRGRGVLGSSNLSKAPFSPTVTVAAGSAGDPNATPPVTVPNNAPGDGDYWGVRIAVKPLGINLGLSYAQADFFNPTGRQVLGADLNAKKLFGLLDLSAEYAISSPITPGFNFNTNPQIFYVKAGSSIGPISLNANYRAIHPNTGSNPWNGISNNTTGVPFIFNQRGFGVDASAPLGFLSLGGYFDSRTDVYGSPSTDQVAFGVNASTSLFGLSLNVYFNNTTLANITQYSGASYNSTTYDSTTGKFGTNLGAKVGAKDLILKGLELGLEFRASASTGGSLGDYSDLIATAKAPLNLAGFSITPNVRFHGFTRNAGPGVSYTTFKFGIQLATPTLNLFILNPSLEAGYAARTTTPAAPFLPVSESRWSVGLKLPDFLLPKGTLGVTYASYSGSNVTNMLFNVDDKIYLYDNANDRLYSTPGTDYGPVTFSGTAVGTLTGVYLSYTYHGVGLHYGSFVLDLGSDGTADSTGHAFRASYTFNF